MQCYHYPISSYLNQHKQNTNDVTKNLLGQDYAECILSALIILNVSLTFVVVLLAPCT